MPQMPFMPLQKCSCFWLQKICPHYHAYLPPEYRSRFVLYKIINDEHYVILVSKHIIMHCIGIHKVYRVSIHNYYVDYIIDAFNECSTELKR